MFAYTPHTQERVLSPPVNLPVFFPFLLCLGINRRWLIMLPLSFLSMASLRLTLFGQA